jgi:hypothetical protein
VKVVPVTTPTGQQIMESLRAMRSVIPFFPREDAATAIISTVLTKLVRTPEELNWLTTAAIISMTKWEGIPQLRALYCTRYTPHDGLPVIPCLLPGFTRRELEAQYERRVMEENDLRIEQWKQEQQQQLSSREQFGRTNGEPVRRIPKVGIFPAHRPSLRKLEQDLEQAKRPVDQEEIDRRAQELKAQIERRMKG